MTAAVKFAPGRSGLLLHRMRLWLGRLLDRLVGNALKVVAVGSHFRDADKLAKLRRDQRLRDLYLYVVGQCIEAGAKEWWRDIELDPIGDERRGQWSLWTLCIHHILGRAGDVERFRRVYALVRAEGHRRQRLEKPEPFPFPSDLAGRFLLDLVEYHRQAMRSLDRQHSQGGEREGGGRRRALVSVVIVDQSSSKIFIDHCLPSLAGGRGVDALSTAWDASLRVYAPANRLRDIRKRLAALGLNARCEAIPTGLAALARKTAPAGPVWLAGTLQFLHISEAARIGADFLSINPNAVYARDFLDTLASVARRERVVLTPALWPRDRQAAEQASRASRASGASLTARELRDLAIDARSPGACVAYAEHYALDRGSSLDQRLVWSDGRGMKIHSTRQELLFLATEALALGNRRFVLRPEVDFHLFLYRELHPHLPGPDEGLAVLDLRGAEGMARTDSAGAPPLDLLVPAFATARQVEIFKRGLAVGADADRLAVANGDYTRFEAELAGLVHRDGPTAVETIGALNLLQHLEASEYGRAHMAAVVDEERRLAALGADRRVSLHSAQRRELIRSSLNCDRLALAMSLAADGGPELELERRLLAGFETLKADNTRWARDLRAAAPDAPMAVVGFIVWGDRFVRRFMDYCLSSLLASGNFPGLGRRRKLVCSIVTTESGRRQIEAHPALAQLMRHACVHFSCFDEELPTRREAASYPFYRFYGLLDHLNVYLARDLRADMHLLPVDLTYSNNVLVGLNERLERDTDCCALAGFECDPSALEEWLNGLPRSGEGGLDIPTAELIDVAVAVPDAYTDSLVMGPGNERFCSHPREIYWAMPQGIGIRSVFMHPLAVSSRLLCRDFRPQHENVDFALLPRLLQGDRRLRVIDDGCMAGAQFGAPAGRQEFQDRGFSLTAFVEGCRHSYAAQRDCFETLQLFATLRMPYMRSRRQWIEALAIRRALQQYRFECVGG